MGTQTEPAFADAEARGFPPFLAAVSASSPGNASPYLTTLQALETGRALANRPQQIRRVVRYLRALSDAAVECEFILLGGSLLQAGRSPRDIDGLFLYRAGLGFDAGRLRRLQDMAQRLRIDARLAPIDGDLLPMLRILLFMGMLYSTNPSGALANGVVLVDCRTPGAAQGERGDRLE